MNSSYRYVVTIFLKFDEVIVEYFAYKRFAYKRLPSVLLLLSFYEGFSIPVENEKSGEGHKSNFHEQ